VDRELFKLVQLEKKRASLGNEGFIPSIEAGKSLRTLLLFIGKLSTLPFIKNKLDLYTSLIIKASLKIKKLNLIKNQHLQTCQEELDSLFNLLHSDKKEEKLSFIRQCLSVSVDPEIDDQELRFLLESICHVIAPVKPAPNYKMNIKKAKT